MKCRRINPENGMVVWFGVKDIKKETAKEFTCGDDKICGAAFKDTDLDVDMTSITVSDAKQIKTVAVFQNESDKHDNYAASSEAIEMSLRQRLSVLKHELWYDYENGMPLIDKTRSKATIDAYVLKTVKAHKDVISIEDFESLQDKHEYSCYMIVNTVYGQIELGL